MTPDERRQLALLLCVSFVVLAAGLGLRSPWPPDEPRFALIARDMAAHGNWLLPTVGGVLYADKPPLFFWVVAALYRALRSIDIALLVPGLVAGVTSVFLVYDLGRRLRDPETGLWCGGILLALVQFPLQMRAGQIDAVLCLWTTLGFYGFCRHLLLGPHWYWYAAGGIASGLGVITKGVGFLPYFVFIPYAIAAVRHWPRPVLSGANPRWLIAPALTVLVIGAWLVPMWFVTSHAAEPGLLAYRDDILFHQTVTRYADSWGHIKPPWYLLTNSVPWLWLPVTLFLPWLVPAWRRDFAARSLPVALFAGWVILVVLFFSLSAGKRSVYILPAAPAVALLAGWHAAALVQRPLLRALLLLLPGLLALAMLGLALAVFMEPSVATRWLPDTAALFAAAGALALTAAAMLAALLFARRRRATAGFAVAMALFWIGNGVLLAPAIDAERSGRELMTAVEARVGSGEKLALVDWPEQFLLQSRRPVYHFGYRRDPVEETRDAARWLAAAKGRFILLPDRTAGPCFDRARLEVIGRAHRRTWVLADASMLSGACDEPREKSVTAWHYVPVGAAASRE